MLSEMIKQSNWGDKVLENLSRDLRLEFSDMQGLSRRNLFNAKKFFQLYDSQLVQQTVALIEEQSDPQSIEANICLQQVLRQVPWGHNILIITKSKDIQEALFYLQKIK